MKKIFVDLEMNPIPSKAKIPRELCRQETIEVGAVKLDEHNVEIDSFCAYVRPQYSGKIYANIVKLTGITWEMVENASSFDMVLQEFLSWCGEDYQVFAWSESDRAQFRHEMNLKKIPVEGSLVYLMEHWIDFQKEYKSLFPIEKIMSLDKALELVGIDFEGRAHDALNDARMTANLYRYVNDDDQFAELQRRVRELFTPSEFTLADFIDLSGLQLDGD
ncbi:MAG: exonuclease domain-containing protein [Blautia sp.]|nr:exonuclease domain-containing protein [Blautia sp.]MBR2561842.1 exonuclease domain-containing protein [Eubacterium sp.]